MTNFHEPRSLHSRAGPKDSIEDLRPKLRENHAWPAGITWSHSRSPLACPIRSLGWLLSPELAALSMPGPTVIVPLKVFIEARENELRRGRIQLAFGVSQKNGQKQ